MILEASMVVAIGTAVVGGAAWLMRLVTRPQAPAVPTDLAADGGAAAPRRSHGWTPVAGADGALRIRLRAESHVTLTDGEIPSTIVEVSGVPFSMMMQLRVAGPLGLAADESAFETGDPDFDREIVAIGPPGHLRAVLDHDTRARLRRVFHGRMAESGGRGDHVVHALGVSLRNGMVRATVDRAVELSLTDDAVGLTSSALVDVGRRLRLPDDVPERLARSAAGDPCAGVRLGCLLTLQGEWPYHALTATTRQAALEDADARVRLMAARESGPAGLPTLLALVTDTRVYDPIASAAAALLDGRIDAAESVRILQHAVREERWATAGASLALVRTARALESLPLVRSLIGRSLSGVSSAAAGVLGALGDTGAEPALVDGLAGPADLRIACARALAAVGSVWSVPALREREASDGDRAVRRAAREAAASIQARLLGAAPGQVALAPEADGRVAFAEAGGDVSLVERPVGEREP